MQAIVCDICGKVLTKNKIYEVSKIKVQNGIEEFDACKKCSDKIKDYVFGLSVCFNADTKGEKND